MEQSDEIKITEEKPAETQELTDEQSPVIQARFKKARDLADGGVNLYPNSFRPTHNTAQIHLELDSFTHDQLEENQEHRTLAGRLMARRDFGKSIFFDLQDSFGRVQIYTQKNMVSPEIYGLVRQLDIGDHVGVGGRVFKTKTGELTILVESLELVTKGLWPLPEKYHEINVELKYRRRYVDLIMNEDSRRVFRIRSKTVAALRQFMTAKDFLEVETPMMQVIPGGAAAKPFETFHNALNRQLYLRIAPELYLKKLLVGGFDRVFELNRNFRNEGLSIQHNPEFTMIEFYMCYANFTDLMDFNEEMFSFLANEILGTTTLSYSGKEINLAGPWPRISFKESLVKLGGAPESVLDNQESALAYLDSLGGKKSEDDSLGKIQAKIFDLVVEPKLWEPTFITYYPADISPLARRNEKDPTITDRFELFMTGRELANGFSELNDPLDQRQRFLAQVAERAKGDDEGMHMDEDYVRALMYGMPPAAGEGLGIDRLVMLLADVPSIRDVILFPHNRPEN